MRAVLALLVASCNCAGRLPDDLSQAQYLLERAVKVEVVVRVIQPPNYVMGRLSGSGVVIYSTPLLSMVLTAKHVCVPKQGEPIAMQVQRMLGSPLHAEVLWVDEDDLCVVAVAGYAGPMVRVLGESPPVGAMVYYAGGPMGFFGDGIGFVEQGHYAGQIDNRILLASTTLSGSSGAGIFYRGSLFGVVVGNHKESNYIVVGVGPQPVLRAVQAAYALLPHTTTDASAP